MSAPVQRRPNTGYTGHPAWCAALDHNTANRGPMHRSSDVTVGRRLPAGLVSARLLQPVGGETLMSVTACQATSATADISLDDARRLRDALTDLLNRAGQAA